MAMNTLNSINVLDAIVPISYFNKGKANQIFTDVKKSGIRIVVKNNAPECVLMSPENYQKLMEEYENATLMAEAQKRLLEPATYLTHDEIMKKEGLTDADLNDIEVDIE